MARLSLKDLPLSMQTQIMVQYGIQKTSKPSKRKNASVSPYADRLEKALVQHFEEHHLCKEYKKAVPNRNFRIDFAYPVEKLAIEFDGYRYHGFSKKGFKGGLQRQNLLVTYGWRVLRYSLTDVRDRLDHILLEVQQSLNSHCS